MSQIRHEYAPAGDNITTKLETLMAGGSIVQHIEENLTYDYLHSSEENLWSVLYLTGYLTKVRGKDLTDSLPDGYSALMIPNAEIREIFETTVSKWFDDSAKAWNRSPLFDAVWTFFYSTEFGDKAKITQPTSGLQYKSIQLFLG